MTGLVQVRRSLKRYLPAPLRTLLRAPLTYAQRMQYWFFILRQIRGATARDQLKLIISALASFIISFRDLGEWKDPLLLFDTDVIVAGVGKFSVRRHTDDLWHVLPRRESAVLAAIKNHLRPGDVFVDAGANIGFYSIVAASAVGSSGKVVAIEMMNDTASILRRHVEINSTPNVEVVQCALSDRSGDTIVARVPIGKHGQASIRNTDDLTQLSEESVTTTTFDKLLAEVETVRLIKMDLEGVEDKAISGARNALLRTQGVIFEEWSKTHGSRGSAQDLLTSQGFNLERIDGRNWIAIR